jgi:actin-related protein
LDILERIWNSIFYESIQIDPTNMPLFTINSGFLDSDFKLDLSEIIFETFNFPKMYSCISNVTGIFAEGRSTGISLDSGYLGTTCMRIFEGYPEQKELEINLFGGCYLGKINQFLLMIREVNRVYDKS